MLRFLLAALVLITTPAIADDAALYDPLPPAGSAFVRTFNDDITPYVALPASEEYREGGFYTLYEHRIFQDPPADDPAKALVIFYNLTDRENLSLKTPDGKIAIVENVGAMRNDSRALNAVRIGFAVYDADGEIAKLEEHTLSRGSAYSVFALPSDTGVDLIFVRSETSAAL